MIMLVLDHFASAIGRFGQRKENFEYIDIDKECAHEQLILFSFGDDGSYFEQKYGGRLVYAYVGSQGVVQYQIVCSANGLEVLDRMGWIVREGFS